MKLEAAVINGDGVGPEMMEEAVRVLGAVCRRFGHTLKLHPVLACSQALEAGQRTSSTGKFKNLYPGSCCAFWKFRAEKISG